MILNLLRHRKDCATASSSSLYDNDTFYARFEEDVLGSKSEILIESPFITVRRLKKLIPYIERALSNGVAVIINTRDPSEHEQYLRTEAEVGISVLKKIGVGILYTGGLHRKIAIIDRTILWEGSLNILSQNDSCEIMRRYESADLAAQIIIFTGMNEFL